MGRSTQKGYKMSHLKKYKVKVLSRKTQSVQRVYSMSKLLYKRILCFRNNNFIT